MIRDSDCVVFYISGHGFGHASRQIEIINALTGRVAGVTIVLRTSVPRWLLERTLNAPFVLFDAPCDTGVVQIDSLRLDPAATIARAREFYADLEDRVRVEAALLREHDARLIISDAPPLACLAAAMLDLPSIVVSNFTWDWIYEEYREYLELAPELPRTIRNAYARADAAWRLPLHGGFESFRRIIDVPFVARHARHERWETRRAFGLPENAAVALTSFGGYGLDELDWRRLDCFDDWIVVVTGRVHGGMPRALHVIDDAEIYEQGFRYEDLVHASDVVVTKPGYGIISECVANGPAVVYTSRGRFREYDVLVEGMPGVLRTVFLDQDDLFRGRWQRALDTAAGQSPPPERPPTNGADVAADMIASMLETST